MSRHEAFDVVFMPSQQQNATAAPYPRDCCLHELFEAQVEQRPDAVAIASAQGHLSYRELNCRANQLAHSLQKLGVKPGKFVGLCLDRSIEMIIAILGVLKAGGTYIPIDPECPSERMAFMLQDTQVFVLVTGQSFLDRLPECIPSLICLDTDRHSIVREDRSNLLETCSPDSLAYLIYTSGSTGKPKGVPISHANLCPLLHWGYEHLRLTPEDRVIQFLNYCFDWSVWEILITLTSGASLHMVPLDTVLNPQQTLEFLAHHNITVLHATPTQFQYLVGQGQKLDTLRQTCIGAEKLTFDLIERSLDVLHPDCRIYNMYGPTEATIMATTLEIERSNTERYQDLGSVPIGPPIANTRCYVLDRHGNPQPAGVPGELYLAGDGLSIGYFGQPELTANKFIPDPFAAGARMYRTGDLARWLPDGTMEYLGRIDQQVKLRGFRIELGEIEAVISQHPTVRENVVVLREDKLHHQRLVAYIIPNQQSAFSTGEVYQFLKTKLPEYMLPSTIVPLEAFPLMPNGKLDRRALPAPSGTRAAMEKVYVAPRDAMELHLLQVWESVLGVQPIGVMDNFFELGGHSLLAIRLMAQIQHKLKQRLPVAALFQNMTVERLAVLLRHRGDGLALAVDTLVPIQQGDENIRPMFFVHPVGGNVFCYVDLARHLGTHLPFYGLQAHGLDGSQELHSSIEEMSSHYIESIRTVQAQGPYLLGGWSMGGLVAFEMAQQLWAQGQTVDRLILIDTHVPGEQRLITAENDSELLAAFIVDWGMLNQVQLELVDLAQIVPEEQLAYIVQQAQEVGVVPPDIESSQVQHLFDVFKNNLRAIEQYRPHVYRGPITLFKASESLGEDPLSTDLGWSAFVADGLAVHQVPGNHFSVLRVPNVQVLSEQIKSYLPVGGKHEANS